MLRGIYRASWLIGNSLGLFSNRPNIFAQIKGRNSTVGAVATAACNATEAGKKYWRQGYHTFNLTEGGRCSTFVRQCVEVALDAEPFTWEYWDLRAQWLEDRLKRNGMQVDIPHSGDIVCMNKTSNPAGHVGIYIDADHIAHHSEKYHGTVITPTYALEHIITGYYTAF